MTSRHWCDLCKAECGLAFDFLKLRGYTFQDGRKLQYFEGAVCFECQWKMRGRTIQIQTTSVTEGSS